MKLKPLILIISICIGYSSLQAQNCNSITKEVDKFKGTITWRSPVVESVIFMKFYSPDTDTMYGLMLITTGSSFSIGDGAYMLFDDGSKIIREDVDVDGDVSSSGYRYTSYFMLTEEEIEILKHHSITDIRNYIYEASITTAKQKKLMGYFNCLVQAN